MKSPMIWILTIVSGVGLAFGFQNCSHYKGAQSAPVNSVSGNPEEPADELPLSVEYCLLTFPGTLTTCSILENSKTIVGFGSGFPPDVLLKMDECVYSLGWFGPSGNGLSVDWGDGAVEPQYLESERGKSCADAVTRHAYSAPGVYTIKVRSWHPGPTDAPVTDWATTLTVVINPQ